MSRRSRAAGHWLNWMIDEPLSMRWAGFKLNPPSIELQLIVPPPTSFLALRVIFHHFSTPSPHQFVSSLFFTAAAAAAAASLRHVVPFLAFLTVNLFSCPMHRLSVASTAPSGHRSSFLWISMVSVHKHTHTHTKSTQSALLVHVSVSCLGFLHFFFFFGHRLSPIS